LLEQRVEKDMPGNNNDIHRWISLISVVSLVTNAIMRFQVNLEKAQRVDSRAATLANRGALLGLADRYFLKHGSE
jgi:hypothetical protein